MPYHEIFLPMPTSVNRAHTVGKSFQKGKKPRFITRSSEYTDWAERARVAWAHAFPQGADHLEGRLLVVYIFMWDENDAGKHSSDIGNREKVLSDFLQKKFFENDNMIDEQRQYRRIGKFGSSKVWVRVYVTDDRRYDSPDLIFNPKN